MALQLTGAGKTDSVANLQVRLPVVVIGGGLTAIDTATESLAYYPVQVEKFLSRYETLVAERGEAAVRPAWSAEEAEVAAEFIDHARQFRAERGRRRAGRPCAGFRRSAATAGAASPSLYRRRLIDAPSYTLNHEEVRLGAAGRHPLRRVPHARGSRSSTSFGQCARCTCSSLHRSRHSRRRATANWSLPARTILVAAGTQPNTVLGREDPRTSCRSTASTSRPSTRAASRSRPSASPSRQPRMC